MTLEEGILSLQLLAEETVGKSIREQAHREEAKFGAGLDALRRDTQMDRLKG